MSVLYKDVQKDKHIQPGNIKALKYEMLLSRYLTLNSAICKTNLRIFCLTLTLLSKKGLAFPVTCSIFTFSEAHDDAFEGHFFKVSY